MTTLLQAKRALVGLGLALCLGTAMARTEPMYVPERITVPDKPGMTQAQLHDALIRGAARRSWIVVSDAPGELLLKQTLGGGKHEATVKVSYDAASYQVSYSSSYNLNADADKLRIHPTYNMWVRNLSSDIAIETAQIGTK